MEMVVIVELGNLSGKRILFSVLLHVRIAVSGQKFLVDDGVDRVVIAANRLDAKVVGAEAVLRLLEGVQLAVGGREAGVMAEVGEADPTLGATLSGQVVLGVGRIQERVQARVVTESCGY